VGSTPSIGTILFNRLWHFVMIQRIKRFLAVRTYAMRLSQGLARRFGVKRFYTVKQVTQAAERGGFTTAFLAYAHAMFCEAPDFNVHYAGGTIPLSYDKLRAEIGRRYCGGKVDFDAATFVRRFRSTNDGQFSESGLGSDGGHG
jgi:hypothetical protein